LFNIGHQHQKLRKKLIVSSNIERLKKIFSKSKSIFRDTFWPNGILADKPPERDSSVRNITQVLCKAKLLGIVSGKKTNRK
jgi:hypothetical protein